MGFGMAFPFCLVKCLVVSYFGTIPKIMQMNSYSVSFGMSIKYGFNLGALTLRYMENNIVALRIF